MAGGSGKHGPGHIAHNVDTALRKIGDGAERIGDTAERVGTAADQVNSAIGSARQLAGTLTGQDGGTILNAAQSVTGDVSNVAGQVSDFASQAAGAVEDPLEALISAGLDFLLSVIQPLQDLLNQVTGDPDALNNAKDSYADVGNQLSQLASDLADTVSQGTQNWSGDAADAATRKMSAFNQGVAATATVANNLSTLCDCSAQLMRAAQDIIKQIISDLVEWLVITWLAAQAAAFVSFGASEGAAAAATVAEVANATEKGEQVVSTVQKIINMIEDVFSKIKGVVEDVQKGVGEFAKESGTVGKLIEEKGGSLGDFAKREGHNAVDTAGDALRSAGQTALDGVTNNGPQESSAEIDSQLDSFSASN